VIVKPLRKDLRREIWEKCPDASTIVFGRLGEEAGGFEDRPIAVVSVNPREFHIETRLVHA
jgi:hypothetical protein